MVTAFAYTTRSASSRLPDNVGGSHPIGSLQALTDDIRKVLSSPTAIRLHILEIDNIRQYKHFLLPFPAASLTFSDKIRRDEMRCDVLVKWGWKAFISPLLTYLLQSSMSPWWPLEGLLFWCPIFKSSDYNSLRDPAAVDVISRGPFLTWINFNPSRDK